MNANTIERLIQTLTVPAAEYVPAISDALLILEEARDAAPEAAEPVAWQVWWGIGKMSPHWPPFKTESDAETHASMIKSMTEVRPLYAGRAPTDSQAGRDAVEAAYQRTGLLEWAVARWRDEVQNRPLVNVHRRTLDDTWRQVMRYAGGDPKSLVGWSHDELLAGHEFEPADRAALSTTMGRAAE